MENILVTTDLSSNSAAAIRFARKLVQLKEGKLVIAYVYQIRKPHSWRTHRFENYLKVRKLYLTKKFNKFLEKIFKEDDQKYIAFEIELVMNLGIITTLLNIALAHKATFICISTQGSGKSKEKFGSITSKLVVKSPIPVISIPSGYQIKPIKEICYVTDMSNYQKEIRKVLEFAAPLQLVIKMLHIVSPQQIPPKISTIEAKLLKRIGAEVKVRFVKRNLVNSLCEDINDALKKMKSKMVVFFIHRTKPHCQSMSHPKNIQPLSFYAKIPMLNFKK